MIHLCNRFIQGYYVPRRVFRIFTFTFLYINKTLSKSYVLSLLVVCERVDAALIEMRSSPLHGDPRSDVIYCFQPNNIDDRHFYMYEPIFHLYGTFPYLYVTFLYLYGTVSYLQGVCAEFSYLQGVCAEFSYLYGPIFYL